MTGLPRSRGVSTRRIHAALVCLAWLLALEVLPNLHLARHDQPHTHAADGTIVFVYHDGDAEPHRHADGTVHAHRAIDDDAELARVRARAEARRAEHRRARDGVLGISRAPADHQASGVPHRAAALHPAPLLLLAVPRLESLEVVAAPCDTGRPVVAQSSTRNARGPPLG